MKVGDLYRFKKPLMHYLSEYEGRLFFIHNIRQNHRGDLDVYDIKMIDNLKTWAFTGHELSYLAEKIQ